MSRSHHIRGFTLVETMVVMVLAGLFMYGLTLLYLAAQRQWIEASSQLTLQQEASLVTEAIAERAREAHRWEFAGDSSSILLERCNADHSNHRYFMKYYWNGTGDSLIYAVSGEPPSGPGQPLSNIKVARLRFAGLPGQPIGNKLRILAVRAKDVYGQQVDMSTEVVLQNFSDW
jgi:prepilin-type N-terminal cleavage/methylation domain-containing protein